VTVPWPSKKKGRIFYADVHESLLPNEAELAAATAKFGLSDEYNADVAAGDLPIELEAQLPEATPEQLETLKKLGFDGTAAHRLL